MPAKPKTKTAKAKPIQGRPVKINKDEFGQVTCVLRHDTIQKLRDGSGSKHFGEFLQHHLDRYPLHTRQEYIGQKLYLASVTEMAKKQKRGRDARIYARFKKLGRQPSANEISAAEANERMRDRARKVAAV